MIDNKISHTTIYSGNLLHLSPLSRVRFKVALTVVE